SEHSDGNNDDVEKDDKDGNVDDEGDDHISDTQDVDDEDDKTESDEDDIYKYKIRVRKDEDEEMKDAEVEGSDKGDEEITDAAKEEAEKTSAVKDDTNKTKLPASSLSLSFSDFVMSDSEDSTVTYTEVSSLFEDLSDIGSSGVIVHGYDGLTIMPEDPYAYVEAALQASPSPDYVPGPEELEQAPPPPDLYIVESDPEEEPKEDDDKDPMEDPTDYPTDKDDDDDEEESSGDDTDDEDEDKEHPAPADSAPVPFLSEADVKRLLALPNSLPSPLTPLSSPLPPIPSPPLPASPTHPLGYKATMIRLRAESLSTCHPLPLPPPIILSHTRATMAMMRVLAPSTYCLAPRSSTPLSGTPPLLPIPLPTSSPPLLLPSTDHS
ncbi:hypothetical protein Tco_1074672, partial [Tanacetum coccineum]